MAYVYILLSTNYKNRYIGSTNCLTRRLEEHNSGKVKSTSHNRPWKLYAFQECVNLPEARILESKYKHSHGALGRAIKNNLFTHVGE